MATLRELAEGLVSYLEDYAGLAALVSDRIYTHPLPEDRVLPAVTWEIVSYPPENVCSYARCHFRMGAFAYTKALSLDIAEQIRMATEKYHGEYGTVHAFSMVDNIIPGAYEPAPETGVWPTYVYIRCWFNQDS